MSRMTSKVWYWVALGLIVPGLALVITAFGMLTSSIQGMHRVVMPGKAEIMLPAGRSTLYAERSSIVDGKAYRVEGLRFRCAVTDPAGKEVPLVAPTSSVSYTTGSYAGENVFDLDIAEPGPYVLACDAPAPFVIAIGGGVGAWIVVMIVGALPIMAGVVIFIVALVKRRRQKRRATMQASLDAAAAGQAPKGGG